MALTEYRLVGTEEESDLSCDGLLLTLVICTRMYETVRCSKSTHTSCLGVKTYNHDNLI